MKTDAKRGADFSLPWGFQPRIFGGSSAVPQRRGKHSFRMLQLSIPICVRRSRRDRVWNGSSGGLLLAPASRAAGIRGKPRCAIVLHGPGRTPPTARGFVVCPPHVFVTDLRGAEIEEAIAVGFGHIVSADLGAGRRPLVQRFGTELVPARWIYLSNDVADGEMPLNRFPKPWSTLKQFLTVWDDLLSGRAVFLPFQLMRGLLRDLNINKGLNLKNKLIRSVFAHFASDISTCKTGIFLRGGGSWPGLLDIVKAPLYNHRHCWMGCIRLPYWTFYS
jgi:hypothetical protein